jgi:hypothetical protein
MFSSTDDDEEYNQERLNKFKTQIDLTCYESDSWSTDSDSESYYYSKRMLLSDKRMRGA